MTLMHFEVSVLALSISCAHSALNASNTVNLGTVTTEILWILPIKKELYIAIHSLVDPHIYIY